MTGDDGVIKIDTNVGTELTTRSEARALTKNEAVKRATCREIPASSIEARELLQDGTGLRNLCVFFGGLFFDAIEIADAKRPGPSENLSGTDP